MKEIQGRRLDIKLACVHAKYTVRGVPSTTCPVQAIARSWGVSRLMASLSSYSSSGGDHRWSDTDDDVEESPAKRVKLTPGKYMQYVQGIKPIL